MTMAAAIRILFICSIPLLAACSTAEKREPVGTVLADPATLHIPAGDYAAAFDAARHTLRDAGFTLERVDAWSGIIITAPSTSAGIVTPWSTDQSTFAQEFGDLAHRNRRIVRVTFEPAAAVPATPPDPATTPLDLRALNADMLMRIGVVLERVNQPGWRIDSTTIRHSSFATDPALVARGMQPTYAVAREEDPLLAARLVRRIARP